MKLFNKSALKLRSEKKEGKFNYYIDYSKLKESGNFKRKLTHEIVGGNTCLAIINTKMFYKRPQDDYQAVLAEIIKSLEELGITYKKILYKKSGEDNILGIKVKVDLSEKQRDFALGIAANYEELERLMPIISKYNLYICIQDSPVGEQELISKFEENHDEVESLNQYFSRCIFDNCAIGQITVFSHSDITGTVTNLINEFNGAK